MASDGIAVTCPLGHGFYAPLDALKRMTSRQVRCPGVMNAPGVQPCVIEIDVAALIRRIERGETDWVIKPEEAQGLQERMAI